MTAREFLHRMHTHDNFDIDPTYVKIDVNFDDGVRPVAMREVHLFDGHYRLTVLEEEPTDTPNSMCDADLRRCVVDYRELLDVCQMPPRSGEHPSLQWMRNSVVNYQWVVESFENLCLEHRRRFGDSMRNRRRVPFGMPMYVARGKYSVPSPPPQQLPVEYQTYVQTRRWINCIHANREFYIHEMYTAHWTKREPPTWFTKATASWEAELASAHVPKHLV